MSDDDKKPAGSPSEEAEAAPPNPSAATPGSPKPASPEPSGRVDYPEAGDPSDKTSGAAEQSDREDLDAVADESDTVESENAKPVTENEFERLLGEQANHVFTEIFYLTGSFELSVQLTRDVFLRAFIAMSNFDRSTSVRDWLTRVVLNVVLHHFDRTRARTLRSDTSRSSDRDNRDENEVDDATAARATRPQLAAGDESADDAGEEVQESLRAFDRLRDFHRGAFILRERHGLDYHQIAEALDTTVGTVKAQISEARQCALGDDATSGSPAAGDTSNRDTALHPSSLSLCYDEEGPAFLRKEVECLASKDDSIEATLNEFRHLGETFRALPELQVPESVAADVRDRIRDETRPLPVPSPFELLETTDLAPVAPARSIAAIAILIALAIVLGWIAIEGIRGLL